MLVFTIDKAFSFYPFFLLREVLFTPVICQLVLTMTTQTNSKSVCPLTLIELTAENYRDFIMMIIPQDKKEKPQADGKHKIFRYHTVYFMGLDKSTARESEAGSAQSVETAHKKQLAKLARCPLTRQAGMYAYVHLKDLTPEQLAFIRDGQENFTDSALTIAAQREDRQKMKDNANHQGYEQWLAQLTKEKKVKVSQFTPQPQAKPCHNAPRRATQPSPAYMNPNQNRIESAREFQEVWNNSPFFRGCVKLMLSGFGALCLGALFGATPVGAFIMGAGLAGLAIGLVGLVCFTGARMIASCIDFFTADTTATGAHNRAPLPTSTPAPRNQASQTQSVAEVIDWQRALDQRKAADDTRGKAISDPQPQAEPAIRGRGMGLGRR